MRSVKNLALALMAFSGLSIPCSASQAALSRLETQFRELPMEARRLTGPLFWLHGDDSREKLEMYVGKVAEGGNGSFTPESRPHTDWLGPGWWRDLDICLASAKKQGLEMWIFDEKWWPSQAVAGKVPPKYAAKRLEASAQETTGPGVFEGEGYSGEKFVAVVAGKVSAGGKIDGDSLMDLKSKLSNGRLRWEVPAGTWRVMKFTHKLGPGLLQQGGKQLGVDGASKDCVDWYLRTVYEPHYQRYKSDFGRTIKGFFYDEPETTGDWGTELNAVLKEWDVDWKKAYVAYMFELSGEEQVAARYQYLDALAETWARTMYGGITKWCNDRGVRSIGHFMEHSYLYRHPEYSAGDMMRLQSYSSMGGIDAVFSQFGMGKREVCDVSCWQTPKLGSSISHAYGKPDDIAMVEIFGARGQDLTYPEMKWWTDHMQVSGVNFLIPHAFNPKSPYDTDCPPYFYNSGFEPRWPLYKIFADYTSRLSLMLTGGKHVCPVALLYLGQSVHTGKHISPEHMSEVLQDALYDCDWIPYEVFERQSSIAKKQIKLREEAYRVLVVPPAEVVPYRTLAKAREFFDKGGVVLGYGFLPSKSATLGKGAKDIAELTKEVWGSPAPGFEVCKTSASGGRSYLLPAEPTPEQLQRVLNEAGVRPTLEVLEGKTDHWLHVLHRVKEGRDVFFIANQNHEGAARTFRFRVTAEGVPECWDPMRNEITSLHYSREGKQVDLSLSMEPNESVLLVFQPKTRKLPPRVPANVARSLALQRQPVPPSETPQEAPTDLSAKSFTEAAWVWQPGGDAAFKAPAGPRYFRKEITIPQDRTIASARYFGTADNSFELFVNGRSAGKGDDSPEGWRNPVELNVRNHLKPGPNQLAIAAANGGTEPNPAGVLGVLTVEFDKGAPMKVGVDSSWKAAPQAAEGWTQAAFDDSLWQPAKEVVRYGAGPWKNLGSQLTLSPVAADPFVGTCELTSSDVRQTRVYLEAPGIAPENAARVTVNGVDVGGFIGSPARLDVTKHVKAGRNTVRLDPFSSPSAKLLVCPDSLLQMSGN